MPQSPILSLVKDYAAMESDAELEAALNAALSNSSSELSSNLSALDEFLKQYMPSFQGDFREGRRMAHLDIHRKKNFTRQQSKIKHSLINGKPINEFDTQIEQKLGDTGTVVNLSLEVALDLHLCMAFNLIDLEDRLRFNPFHIHFI